MIPIFVDFIEYVDTIVLIPYNRNEGFLSNIAMVGEQYKFISSNMLY